MEMITEMWKQPKCPLMDKCIKKICYTFTVGYYLTTKNETNPAICDNMDES